MVDDDPVQRLVAGKLLEACDVEVVTVGDGFTALEALRHRRFDVVLLDCHLQTTSGLDVTRAIRSATTGATSPLVPVVAVTGDDVDVLMPTYLAAGMDDALRKPLRRVQVQELVDRWVRQVDVAIAPASAS